MGEASESKRRWRCVALGAALFVLTLVAMLPAARAMFTWDDDLWLTENRFIRDGGGLWPTWFEPRASGNPDGYIIQYCPLTPTSFWMEYRVYGTLWGEGHALHPMGYHIVNMLLEGGSAVLLWRVLARWGIKGAWLAAAAWAIHPVQVESVAWAVERKNVLSAFFFFGAMLAYTHFEPALGAIRKNWGLYALAIGLFVLALFSKATTCVLPAVILLVLWWKRGVSIRSVWPTAPLFAVGLSVAGLVAWVEKGAGATGPEFQFGLLQRMMIAGLDLWFYAWKLLFPQPLLMIYPRWNPAAMWQMAFFGAAIVVAVVLFVLRNRIGRGPLAAAACFAVILSPAMGFINFNTMVYTFVADHYQHLASAAPIVLAVEGIRRVVADRVPVAGRYVAAGVILAILGGVSFYNASLYADNIRLWSHTAQHNDSWVTRRELGYWYLKEKRFSEAEAQLRRSIELKDNAVTRGLLAGVLLPRNPVEAESQLHRANELEPLKPRQRSILGLALDAQGRSREANAVFLALAREFPEDTDVLFNLATNCGKLKMRKEAVGIYERIISLNPLHFEARFNLANQLLDAGKYAEAVEHYRFLLGRGDNADVWFNLAYAYHQMGRDDLAVPARRRAEQLEKSQKPPVSPGT